MPLSPTELSEKDSKISRPEISARSLVGQLNWLSGISRPYISFYVYHISRKISKMKVRAVTLLNKIITHIKSEENRICFPNLDLNTVKLIVYTDACFNNLPDGGRPGGYIIFITDHQNRCSPLVWNSSKIKRVVRPTLAAETLALNEGCETAIYISKILEEILVFERIPIIVITDNKPLYKWQTR